MCAYLTVGDNICSGRFTRSLYRQMGIEGMVADNASHYVDIAFRLLVDSDWWRMMALQVQRGFAQITKHNHVVAAEWSRFIQLIAVSQ